VPNFFDVQFRFCIRNMNRVGSSRINRGTAYTNACSMTSIRDVTHVVDATTGLEREQD